MFGLGTIALTLALSVLTDSTTQSNEIATAAELRQVAQIGAAQIQDAVAVAISAGTGIYIVDTDLPPSIGGRSYTLTVTPGTTNAPPNCPTDSAVVATSEDGDITAQASLDNAANLQLSPTDCLDIAGSVHSSAGSVRVKYDPTAEPEITITSTPR